MKIYNYIDTALTNDEVKTLNDFFDLLTEKGRTFIGAALVEPDTVIMINMNIYSTVEKMKERAVKAIEENMSNMPDFAANCFPEKKLAYVMMNNNDILAFIPYEEKYASIQEMPLGPSLMGRAKILTACEKGIIKAAAWSNENKIISED